MENEITQRPKLRAKHQMKQSTQQCQCESLFCSLLLVVQLPTHIDIQYNVWYHYQTNLYADKYLCRIEISNLGFAVRRNTTRIQTKRDYVQIAHNSFTNKTQRYVKSSIKIAVVSTK